MGKTAEPCGLAAALRAALGLYSGPRRPLGRRLNNLCGWFAPWYNRAMVWTWLDYVEVATGFMGALTLVHMFRCSNECEE